MGGIFSATDPFKLLVLLAALLSALAQIAEDMVIIPNFDPPKIRGDRNETVVTAGRNLTLQCDANQPVTWELPNNLMIDNMEETFVVIGPANTPKPDNYSHGVQLQLFNVTVADVGFYTCLFNTTDNNLAIDELEAMGEARRIYVYVDDPERLMVPIETVVSGTQYKSIIIPCRPSAPNVEVELFRGENKITPNKHLSWLNDRVVTYDRRSGFTIPELEMGDSSLLYYCHFNRDGRNETSMHAVSVMSHTTSVTKPLLNDSSNGNVFLDGKLELDCRVRVETGVPFHLKWTYPDKTIDETRLYISNTTIEKTLGQNRIPQNMGKSTLTISNVTKRDNGYYRCEIFDANANKNYDEKLITVHEKGYSYINLTEPAGKYKINVQSGKIGQWVIHVDSFPTAKIKWFDNHNNEITKQWSSSHTTKYEVKSSPTTLRINNASLADSGVYQLMAFNEYETKILNLTLIIEAKPAVNLDSKQFYMAGTRASVKCELSGYPLPKVTWSFQPKSGGKDLEDQEIARDQYTIVESNGHSISSIVTLYVNQSGYLTCGGQNKLGKTHSTSAFYESDIEDGFGIVRNIETIGVGDNVTLTCAASVFRNFTGRMNWYKLPEETLVDKSTHKGIFIRRQKSEYSHQLIMSVPKIEKSHSGEYACKAETVIGGDEEQVMSVLVHDVEFPSIISTNMNNSEIQFELGKPNVHFFCHAKGIPIPVIKWYKDGVPQHFNNKDGRVALTDSGRRLDFKYIKEEDSGKYSCEASSRVNKASKYIILSISNGEFKLAYIVTIIVLAIVFVFLISYLIWKIRKEKQIRKELSIAGLLHFEEGATECLNPELGVDEQAELLPYDKKWEFPREMLKLGKQLGSGAFGVVMKAVAQNIVEGEESTIVAVKMVKKTADSTFIKALASELKIMVHLGKHLNVVNLLGACTKNVTKRELLVIVEYCRFGNLHNYLLRHREHFIDQVDHSTDIIDPTIGSEMINRAYSISSNKSGGNKYAALPLLRSQSSKDDQKESGHNSGGPHSPGLDTNNTVISMVPNGDEGCVVSSGSVQPEWRSNYRGDYNYNRDVRPISTQDLLCWSFQVARGMEYLANRKVLHGDLAARNILLADDNIVKICDFGLAKSMYKSDNYKKKGDGPLPVKWMAIESIRDRVFSTQSDVWSYGIVLWELFSLASTPYPGMEADEKFYNRIIKGYRMEKPPFANKQIYHTMLECWHARPIQRPGFTELAERLGYLLEDSVRKHYIDLNDPYMDMNSRWIAERGDSDYLAMMNSPDYGNLVSATPKHDYVNDPFGGPTRVNPLSPDDTDVEGYLCMSPAKNGVVSKDMPIFDFTSPTHKRNKSNLLDEDKEKSVELIPMLSIDNTPQRPGSDSDLGESNPASPRSTHSPMLLDVTSFANPSYQPMFKIPNAEKRPKDNIIVTPDNYVNMSQKDSGFCESLDTKISPSAFTNPSYVTMHANNKIPHMYNNVPTSTVV